MSSLYSIYDSVSDCYVFFGEFDHDRTAVENFLIRCSLLPRTGSDFFLCRIGSYSSESGDVLCLDRPQRIARGYSVDGAEEKEAFSSAPAEAKKSNCKDGSQVKKRINLLRSRGFYAVLFTLLLAAVATYLCACNGPFINIEEVKNGEIF